MGGSSKRTFSKGSFTPGLVPFILGRVCAWAFMEDMVSDLLGFGTELRDITSGLSRNEFFAGLIGVFVLGKKPAAAKEAAMVVICVRLIHLKMERTN